MSQDVGPKRRGRARILQRIAALAASSLFAGCGGDGGGIGGTGDIRGVDARNLGGAQPQVTATCGADLSALSRVVYVSTRGSDGDGCGRTSASACKTISQGIANCAAAGCGVLVRHGLYPTAVTIALRESVNVYGSCLFDGEPERMYRTTIQASPPAGAPAVLAASLNAPTSVQGLVVIGRDETTAGSASLAMVVRDSKGLTITGTVLSSGKGGNGRAGNSSGSVGSGVEGAAGPDGGKGGPSCTASPAATPAGEGGQGGIDDMRATWNGSFTCVSSDGGGAGQPSGDGTAGGARGSQGSHGLWCNTRPHDQPGDGAPGVDGPAGGCGAAAQPSAWSSGSFDGTSWVASKGDDGKPGAVGGGGGGGGAGGACVTYTES